MNWQILSIPIKGKGKMAAGIKKENYKGKKQSGLKNQVGTDFGPKKQYKNTLFCSSRCF